METNDHEFYSMHYLDENSFKNMTSMNVWWEDLDRIMDLNDLSFTFINKFKIMSEETTTDGGRTFKQLLAEFVRQEDVVEGKRPGPGGMDWIGAKRILAVMNSGKKHFVALDILWNKGVINVYDCNIG